MRIGEMMATYAFGIGMAQEMLKDVELPRPSRKLSRHKRLPVGNKCDKVGRNDICPECNVKYKKCKHGS